MLLKKIALFQRYPVPRNKIKWSVDFEDYNPIEFSSPKILAKGDGLNWKDPHWQDLLHIFTNCFS